MKTNIKFFWLVNAITLIVIGTVYAHLTYGLFEPLISNLISIVSWNNIKTFGPYVAVIIVDIVILFTGILPFVEALYEETTNKNTHTLRRYNKFLENIKQTTTDNPEFKNNIEYLIKNHTETAYQSSARNMMSEFGNASPEVISVYINRMAKDPSSIILTDILVSISDNQLIAYDMYSRLGKPKGLKKMSHLDDNINQFNSIIESTMLNKQSDDTKVLLETVGV